MAGSPTETDALPRELRLPRARPGDEPLADDVYRVLRDQICEGRLEGGRRLAQIPIAEHLGISRTPVREALLRLENDGLVHSLKWRGFVVSELSPKEMIDIYDVRLPLELLAARLAVGKLGRAQLAALRDNCDAMEEAAGLSPADAYELNRAFHAGVVAACDNPILIHMLDQLWARPGSLRLFHAQLALGDTLRRSAAEHAAIVDALEAKDAPLVAELLGRHIEAARAQALAAAQGHQATAPARRSS